MAKNKAGKKRPPKMDPVLPFTADTGIRPVREGEGHDILTAASPTMIIELPYRAFYSLWEMVEARARNEWPKYKEGPLSHIADMRLEQVSAFRTAAAGVPVVAMSPKKANKARRILAKIEEEEAAANRKRKKNGDETVVESPSSSAEGVRCPETHKGERCTSTDHGKHVHRSKSYEWKYVTKNGKRKKKVRAR